MRLFFLLVVFTISARAEALSCPDFSGAYLSQNEDEDINLKFTQSGCESAIGHYDYGYGGYVNDRKMIFDGVLRQIDTVEGYRWLEGFHWEGSELLVENEYHSDVSHSVSYSKGRIYLNEAKDLLEETVWYDENWKEIQRGTYTYKRQ